MPDQSEEKQTEILKRLSTSDRLLLAFGLHDLAYQRIWGEQKRLHPELNPSEIENLVKQRLSR